MERALELAWGQATHPNPRVGAVVIRDGEIVGEGAHHGPGSPHAEAVALASAGERARGAEMYVTLEPCSHHGRTPPCVDAVLAAGVSRVVVGVEDPDTRVSGKGLAALRAGGVDVVMWGNPARAKEVDPGYFHHRRTGFPRVVAKFAMTLDGSVAALDGTSQWITSEEARSDAHRLRAAADAVVVGAGTLRADDPRLDVRLDGFEGDGPRPVIVAGTESLPPGARIWQRQPVVIATGEIDVPSGELIVVDGNGGHPDPEAAARALADYGLIDLLVEGGPRLLGSWWAAGLITVGYAYLGAKVGGGQGISPIDGVFSTIDEARTVEVFDVQSFGPDVRIGFR